MLTRENPGATLLPAMLLVALLTGCGKSAVPEAVPPAPVVPAAPAELPAPAVPAESPAAPTQPAPSPPSPQEPAAAPSPAAATALASEPAVSSMRVAKASAKITVPVDLRYQFDGDVLPNQPVMLHLAALPRVPGARLQVSVKATPGLRLDANDLTVQKASADGVYRQQMSITALTGAPDALRVLVTMDMPEGTAFGFFTVPFGPATETGPASQKQDSVKQR